MIIHCPACGQAYDITKYPEQFEFPCGQCGAQLTSELLNDEHTAEGTMNASSLEEAGVESPSSSFLPAQTDAPRTPLISDLPIDDEADHTDPKGEDAALIDVMKQAEQDGSLLEDGNDTAAMAVQSVIDGEDPGDTAMMPVMSSDRLKELGLVRAEAGAGPQALSATKSSSSEHTMRLQGPSQDYTSQEDDFDPSQHIEHGEGVHTLAAAPASEQPTQGDLHGLDADWLEPSSEESTAVTQNPLLANQHYTPEPMPSAAPMQAQGSPMVQVDPAFQLEVDQQDPTAHFDPLGQTESTAVTQNPLLQAQAQPVADWTASQQPELTPAHQASGYTSHPPMGAAPISTAPSGLLPTQTPEPQNTAISPAPTHPTAGDPLAEASPANTTEMEDVALLVPRTDGRALAGFFLLPFVVLGPFCLLLGLLSYRRISADSNLFKGKGLSLMAIIGGTLESLLLGTLLTLFFLFPQGHPVLTSVSKTVRGLVGFSDYQNFEKLPPHDPTITDQQAHKLLLSLLNRRSDKPTPPPRWLYTYQPKGAKHAYIHWRNESDKQNQRSLLLYSNRKHWHVASLYMGKGYEVRCAKAGGARLDDSTARELIQAFWKLRGRFTGVRITHLYVVQEPESRRAHAYWQLTKQMPGKPIKQWQIKSLYHRSLDGKWYLSRYAIRIPKDEHFSHSAQGKARLDKEVAQRLLETYNKDEQKSYSPSSLYVYQAPKERDAYAHWKSGRSTYKSLYRRNNKDKWVLARPTIATPLLFNYRLKDTSRLTIGEARPLISRYVTNHARKMLNGPFLPAGKKGKPPRRMPLIKRMVILRRGATARVLWQATFPNKPLFFESLFYHSQAGDWYLAVPLTGQRTDLRFARRAAHTLTADLAKELIQQFWREDEQSETYNGARIDELYVYQNKTRSTAWAHWRKQQAGLDTSMRTRFVYTNGEWLLDNYDMGLGYRLKFHEPGEERLDSRLARRLLKQHLAKQAQYRQASILMPYVYQKDSASVAYVRWVMANKGKLFEFCSLFHRSNKGVWYLSLGSMPQLIPEGL